MAEHANFTVKTGIEVYFCDPHSPDNAAAMRTPAGSYANTSPQGTDLSSHNHAELDAIADELNNRPREPLGWRKPTEILNKFLVEVGGSLST